MPNQPNMDLMCPAKEWATIGANLYSTSSAADRELANSTLDVLFKGDAKGKDRFVERFFGNKQFQEADRTAADHDGEFNPHD